MKFILVAILFMFINSLPSVAQEIESEILTRQDSIDAGLKVKKPQFVGGNEVLFLYLKASIKYPPDAIKRKIYGTVRLEFTISKTGKVENVKVIKSLSASCDAEAIRVISSMPDWIPAEYNGENIAVTLKIPITFRTPLTFKPRR